MSQEGQAPRILGGPPEVFAQKRSLITSLVLDFEGPQNGVLYHLLPALESLPVPEQAMGLGLHATAGARPFLDHSSPDPPVPSSLPTLLRCQFSRRRPVSMEQPFIPNSLSLLLTFIFSTALFTI